MTRMDLVPTKITQFYPMKTIYTLMKRSVWPYRLQVLLGERWKKIHLLHFVSLFTLAPSPRELSSHTFLLTAPSSTPIKMATPIDVRIQETEVRVEVPTPPVSESSRTDPPKSPSKTRGPSMKHKSRSQTESLRESEKSLQQLLEDFEEGKLNAFGMHIHNLMRIY